MRRPASVLVAALALALVLPAVSPAPADAAGDQVLRTWTAKLGSSGANGRGVLRAYRSGIGTLALSVKALRRNATYAVQIRSGTCSSLGYVLTRTAGVRTGATGAASTIRPLTMAQMNAVWKVARTRNIALRLVSGTSVRCANLTFPRSTRVVFAAYGIDLAVIPGPSGYPPCRVAMYLRELWQPREPGVTMIYAHARRGMFLPLLRASQVNGGRAMLGKRFKVYTNDNRVHVYTVIAVRRHVRSIQSAAGVTSERMYLYTSEGPSYRYPKLVIVAKRLYTSTASYAASHPRPRPVAC